MEGFVFEMQPDRVTFGPHALDHLPREIEQLSAKRAFVLSTPTCQTLALDVATSHLCAFLHVITR